MFVMNRQQSWNLSLLPVRGGGRVESVAAGAALHRPDGVGAGATRVALELVVRGQSSIELWLFARVLVGILDAIIYLAGGQLFQQVFWHSHQQQTGERFYEKAPDPRCHFMRRRFPCGRFGSEKMCSKKSGSREGDLSTYDSERWEFLSWQRPTARPVSSWTADICPATEAPVTSME